MNMTDTRQVIEGLNTQDLALLGEIISWSLPDNTVIAYPDLISALRRSDLDEKVAREMLPRHAFARAAKQLASDRIIRAVKDEGGLMEFQFTKEFLDGSKYRYDYEATLVLDKDTGKVKDGTGGHDALAAQAQGLLEKAKNERMTADITRYIMALFSKQADLFPVRAAGGVYFVPQKHAAFIDKIEQFVGEVHGTVTRFPVPAGTKQGNKSVKAAVKEGLQTLIEEHLTAVTEFGTDTRPSTLERAARKIETVKFKIESYMMYLEEERDNLNANLAAVELTLKQKIAQVLAAKA
jgi:hypothetical protein